MIGPTRQRQRRLLVLLLCLGLASGLAAQTASHDSYQAKREKAEELFAQGKRLEALPLLEELALSNPKDGAVLVDLAACLVDHAATLDDQQAAGKERVRARDLLDQAWGLGNTSPLAMNLSQLLRQLPPSGALKFSDNPEVDQALRSGEAAFSRRDFAQALKDYARALELEPRNYTAALFTGNTYDKQDQFAEGAEWYDRAIRIDPNVETAYRYYADMLAREGNMAKARAMLIQAAIAEPYNRMVWRELNAWAVLNHTQINRVYIGVPAEQESRPPSASLPSNASPGSTHSADIASVWQAYRAVRAKWLSGGEARKHLPGEKEYRHSLPEESAALTAAAETAEKLDADPKTAGLVAGDPSIELLLKLDRAGLIEPYVLFSLGDTGIARDYAAYRAANRQKLEEYMDKFVVPAV